ncbi:MAG: S41 family peptidase [Salinimicrobium sp.]
MKKLLMPVFLCGILFVSCSKEEVPKEKTSEKKTTSEPEVTEDIEVEQFIYRAMNDIYLYKADVPELADDYFSSTSEKDGFLAAFDSPETCYSGLQSDQDHFSFMMDDYTALEKMLNGISKSNGMNFALGIIGDSDDVFGYVRYVQPGTSAEENGIKRGDIFTEVNGVKLTRYNYGDLISLENYSINLGEIKNGYITMSDKTVSLTSVEYSEDPVFMHKVIEKEGRKIGYLMYLGFYGTDKYNAELNNAFGDLKAQGVTDLVLDLRYNGGGSVSTAIDLSSMITGQFNDKVFIQYEYNEDYQDYYEKYRPSDLYLRMDSQISTGEAINNLNLSKVYVLATGSSASASELVINGLSAYIDVVHVGTNTRGKFQASTTLYDSPNFWKYDENGKWHVNSKHTYALQPLILKYANANGVSDFVNGLTPDIEVKESLSNYGVLGDPSETLFKAAIDDILGNQQEEVAASQKRASRENFRFVGESDMLKPTYQRMYVDPTTILRKEK